MNAIRKPSPMNPHLIQVWNKGREAGKKEATELFHEFLTERMQTLQDIPGIGEKTAWKVHQHFIERLE